MKRLIIAALLLSFAPPGFASNTIEERAPLENGGLLMVVNTSGEVTISGWSKNEVEVRGTLGREAENLIFDVDGDEILVKVEQKKDHDGHYPNSGTVLNIRAPRGANLKVNTVSADVKISDIRGTQRVRTVSADLHSNIEGEEAELRTVSGDLRVTGNGKIRKVDLYTVSGDITGSGLAGELRVESVSGDMEVSGEDIGEAHLKTVSGNVEGALRLNRDARIEMESVSGDIEMRIPKNFEAEYELTAFSGDISKIFGKEASRKSKYSPGSELMYTHGKSKARVRANTMSGDVEIDPSL